MSLIFIANTSLFAKTFIPIPNGANEEILQIAQKGQVFIFNRQYEEAKNLFQQVKKKYPQSPMASFGMMMLYNSIMFEDYNFSLQDKFEIESLKNKKIVSKIHQDKNASAWDLFLCGGSSGLRGFYYMRRDEVFAALGEAKIARECLERSLKKDPSFIDAKLGLGMYDYWRSVFTNRIKILPFFKDRRKEGIKQILEVAQKGMATQELAQVALIFVYMQDKNSSEGLELSRNFLKKYPSNIIVKIHEGRFLIYQRKLLEAIRVFDEIQKTHPQNPMSYFYKGNINQSLGKYSDAKNQYIKYLETKPSPAWQAYTRYRLGLIELHQKNNMEAWSHFKKGHNIYPAYKPNLKMILRLRKEKTS